MANKSWPADGSTVFFPHIADPIREAVDELYVLERKPEKDIEWTGLTLGERELCGCFEPDHRLTLEQLKYDEDDQGRDPMRVLISIAVQLGIEQGRRSFVKEMQGDVRLCGLLLDNANREMKQATEAVKKFVLPKFHPKQKG